MSSTHSQSLQVHLDEPEQLRAVSADLGSEGEPALPVGDDLPRITPTKRLARSASRDVSPEAMNIDAPSLAGGRPTDSADDMLPMPMPLDDLPELPPIVHPAAGDGHSPAANGREAPDNAANMEEDDMDAAPVPHPHPDPSPPAAEQDTAAIEVAPDLPADPLPATDMYQEAFPLDEDMDGAPGEIATLDKFHAAITIYLRCSSGARV